MVTHYDAENAMAGSLLTRGFDAQFVGSLPLTALDATGVAKTSANFYDVVTGTALAAGLILVGIQVSADFVTGFTGRVYWGVGTLAQLTTAGANAPWIDTSSPLAMLGVRGLTVSGSGLTTLAVKSASGTNAISLLTWWDRP